MPRRISRPTTRSDRAELPVNGKQRGQQTRDRVLDVAAGLVLSSSVSEMSISELVRLAGVPASSIYWHFGSKEGLVAAMAAAAVERWLLGLPDPQSLPETGEARVLAGIVGVTDALARDGRVVALVTKVGVELGAGRHTALEVVRNARADVLDYGVQLFAPAFPALPDGEAKATARRMAAVLMATADGIAVDAATRGRGTAVADDYRVLAELAILLYRHEAGREAPERRPSRARQPARAKRSS